MQRRPRARPGRMTPTLASRRVPFGSRNPSRQSPVGVDLSRRSGKWNDRSKKPGKAAKPVKVSPYAAEIRRGRRNRRIIKYGGLALALLGALGLSWLILRPNKAPVPPVRDKTHLVQPAERGPRGVTSLPTGKTEPLVPREEPAKEVKKPEAKREPTDKERMEGGIAQSAAAREDILKRAQELGLKYKFESPSWRQLQEYDPRKPWPSDEWKKVIKENQLVRVLDWEGGRNEVKYGIVYSTKPLLFELPNGAIVGEQDFMPGQSYVQFIYDSTK